MANGTLLADIEENATVLVSLTYNTSWYPLRLHFPFCDVWNRVEQEDGLRCPPTRGEVEMMSILYAPGLLSPPNTNIPVQLEAWQKHNETRVACLNSTIEIRDAACNPPPTDASSLIGGAYD